MGEKKKEKDLAKKLEEEQKKLLNDIELDKLQKNIELGKFYFTQITKESAVVSELPFINSESIKKFKFKSNLFGKSIEVELK